MVWSATSTGLVIGLSLFAFLVVVFLVVLCLLIRRSSLLTADVDDEPDKTESYDDDTITRRPWVPPTRWSPGYIPGDFMPTNYNNQGYNQGFESDGGVIVVPPIVAPLPPAEYSQQVAVDTNRPAPMPEAYVIPVQPDQQPNTQRQNVTNIDQGKQVVIKEEAPRKKKKPKKRRQSSSSSSSSDSECDRGPEIQYVVIPQGVMIVPQTLPAPVLVAQPAPPQPTPAPPPVAPPPPPAAPAPPPAAPAGISWFLAGTRSDVVNYEEQQRDAVITERPGRFQCDEGCM